MAIRYMKIKKIIHVGYSPGEKYLAKIIFGDMVGIDRLSEMIAETSSLSEGDINSVLIQMQKVVPWLILEGIPVDLGRLGKLYPGIKAKAVNTYEEVTNETIEEFYVRFNPSSSFKSNLKSVRYEFHEVETKGYAPKPTPPTPPTP